MAAGRRLAGVVLAAGGSTRMGSPKPLLVLGARTYLEAIVETLQSTRIDPLVVVLGHEADTVRRKTNLATATVLVNADWQAGMLSSLQLAVRELSACPQVGGLLLCLVDSPRFSGGTVRALAAAFAATGAPLLVPVHGGRRGHPVIFARSTWGDLLAAPSDRGARVVVEAHRSDVLEVQVDDPWILHDADTLADHLRMQGDNPDSVPAPTDPA